MIRRRRDQLLLLAFFLSGASGLIYQTVWVRMLTRTLGTTTHATSVVLGVFMAGLALGGWLGGLWAERLRRPVRAYAGLEVVLAVAAAIASFAIGPIFATVYPEFAYPLVGRPGLLLALRVGVVAALLLPPTVMMGATLPLLVRQVVSAGEIYQVSLARLYAGNTFGAVAGVLAAGFVLIGSIGETATLAVAMVGNLIAAALALWSVRDETALAGTAPPPSPEIFGPAVRRLALLAIFLSGLTALAYEILWTRMLIPILETSIYSFATMLALFLVGIAWGSWESSRRELTLRQPLLVFSLTQMFIGLWAVIGMALYPWFDLAWSPDEGVIRVLTGRLVKGVAIVLPAAFAFGLQFPAAARCALPPGERVAASLGRVYGINTVGAILGALLTGFVLVPQLGTANTLRLLAVVNLLAGIGLLAVATPAQRSVGKFIAAGFAIALAGLLFVVGDPYYRLLHQRLVEIRGDQVEIFSFDEGVSGTTVAAGIRNEPLARNLLVNGSHMTILNNETKLLAHLPLAIHDAIAENRVDADRLLVMCFGMGTTLRSAFRYPLLEIDAVDIVPHVFACLAYFHPADVAIVSAPNVALWGEDGRNFLLVRPEKYDVITIDPAPPLYSAGTVNLYTREFFALCKQRLTPNGVLCLWLPPGPQSELLMVMRTFLEVFPQASLWGGLESKGFFLVGAEQSTTPNPAQFGRIVRRLARIEEMGEWSQTYRDPNKVQQTLLLDAAGLRRLCESAPVVTDDRPYTEFPLWRYLLDPAAQRILTADHIRNPTDPVWVSPR